MAISVGTPILNFPKVQCDIGNFESREREMFSKLILNKKIDLKSDAFKENDPGSHLKEEYHATIFTQEIINLLK